MDSHRPRQITAPVWYPPALGEVPVRVQIPAWAPIRLRRRYATEALPVRVEAPDAILRGSVNGDEFPILHNTQLDRNNITNDVERSNRMKKIAEFREEIKMIRAANEGCTAAYTRTCTICFVEKPAQRAVFSNCGHLFCLACAMDWQLAAIENRKELACPNCRLEGGFVKLFETVEDSQ